MSMSMNFKTCRYEHFNPLYSSQLIDEMKSFFDDMPEHAIRNLPDSLAEIQSLLDGGSVEMVSLSGAELPDGNEIKIELLIGEKTLEFSAIRSIDPYSQRAKFRDWNAVFNGKSELSDDIDLKESFYTRLLLVFEHSYLDIQKV